MSSVQNRRSGIAMAGLVGLAVLAASCAAPATLGQRTSPSGTSGTPSALAGSGPAIPVDLSARASTSTPTSSTVAARSIPRTSTAPPPNSTTITPVPPSPIPKRTAVFGTPTHPIKVQVTGMVLADQHGRVVMCPPFPDGGLAYTSPLPPTPRCLQGKPVIGVDMGRITLPEHNSTHRWGRAHIEGTWDGNRLTTTSQRLPADTDRYDDLRLPEGVPCPAPPGGWARGPLPDENRLDKVPAAVGPDFGMLMIGVPNGFPISGSADPSRTVQVVIVGVTRDQAAATTAIRRVFDGNLCPAHSDTTEAEIRAQNDAIGKALGGNLNDHGVMDYGQQIKKFATQNNQINVVVDTPDFEARMANISGPAITITPWIAPLP